MRRRKRLLRNNSEEDPMSGLTNLFDLGMVLAVALMVALVSRHNMTEMLSDEDYTIVLQIYCINMYKKVNFFATFNLIL